MKSTVSALESQGIPVRRVDVAREQHLIGRYRVTSIPTYIVMSSGREVARYQGAQSLETLRAALSRQPSFRSTGAVTGSANQQRSSLVPVTPQSNLVAVPPDVLMSEAMPSASVAGAIERARAATVRIRVQENGAVGIATGTIIDTHGAEALVLTCGHVFRDTKGQTPISVEVFAQGRIIKVPGQVIDYDAGPRDIGLVSIRPGVSVAPVPVVGSSDGIRSGSPAFSFGCDRGADPSRRDTRITAVNKYNQNIGASNLEIAGAPTIGRSGGGLFDQQGNLIGVCNAADFEDDIGIYTGPGSIRWQLDRVDLARLYQPRPTSPRAPTELISGGRIAPRVASLQSPSVSDEEVVVILRNKNQPDTPLQVKTFDKPPAEIMRLLGR